MVSRKYKYYNTKVFYNFFENQENKLYLFVHLNNISAFENHLINLYCQENKIESIYIKSSLIAKMTTNKILLSLFSGPTKVYCFSNLATFLNFFATIYVKDKLLPLTVFWNKNFYAYKFFIESLNLQNKLFSGVLSNESAKIKFLSNLSSFNTALINILHFKNFLKFLTILKNNKITN